MSIKPHADLFHETLLVNQDGTQIFTTSLKVAEYFGKNHQHVLRQIRSIEKQLSLSNFGQRIEFSQLNFILRKYQYSTAKNQTREAEMYLIGHDGFAILAMGFTGQKAFEWKIKFLEAFRTMESQLNAQKDREADALYHIRPRWKPILNNPTLKRVELIELTGHASVGSISTCRRRMRDVGLIVV